MRDLILEKIFRARRELKVKNVKISNLSFSYAGTDRLILKDIDMEVNTGEFVCLLGQSGCGKSTFLRLLAGLEKPTTGEIQISGQKVEKAGQFLLENQRQRLGYGFP